MKDNFAEHLKEKVVLGDGAFGTYLFEKGVDLAKNTDLLNISDPDLVYSIHEEYIRAGSELIETNTFGANRFKMLKVGREHRVREINLRGAELACRAAGDEIFVAGSIGPTGVKFPLESDETESGTVQEAFVEQMTALLEGGVDLFIIETFTYLDELLLAIETAKKIAPDIPVVAQMVYPFNGRTAIGLDALACGRATAAAGATVVGTNCGRGVKAMLSAVERLSPLKDEVFLSAFPNAGLPEVVEHRMVYSTPPSYMAEKVTEMVKLGVRLIGGCCGTTPDHIREFRKHLRLKRHKAVSVAAAVEKSSDLPEDRKDSIGRGGMIESLRPGRIPVLVEVENDREPETRPHPCACGSGSSQASGYRRNSHGRTCPGRGRCRCHHPCRTSPGRSPGGQSVSRAQDKGGNRDPDSTAPDLPGSQCLGSPGTDHGSPRPRAGSHSGCHRRSGHIHGSARSKRRV